MNLFHGHLLEEPGSTCLQWRCPSPETLPAHCFVLRGLRASSRPPLGTPGSVPALDSVLACSCRPAGSAAWESVPVLRLEEKQHQHAGSAEEISYGEKGCFPVPPPAQPKAWASPEQGQGKQEAAGGLRELGELGRHLLNLYQGANPGFRWSDTDSSSHRYTSRKCEAKALDPSWPVPHAVVASLAAWCPT